MSATPTRRYRARRRVPRRTARLPSHRVTPWPARAARAPGAPTDRPARALPASRTPMLRRGRRSLARSSDLSPDGAESDGDHGESCEQNPKRRAAGGRGRPERESGHEAALPAHGPLAHRHLERGREGGVDRFRRTPEPQEPIVTHLPRHLCQIAIAVEDALAPPPPPGIALEELRWGIVGRLLGTPENGGPAAHGSAAQAGDRGDREAVDTPPRPPPACPVLVHHKGLTSLRRCSVPGGGAGQVIAPLGQPASYSLAWGTVGSIEGTRPEAAPEPVFDSRVSRRRLDREQSACPKPGGDQRHAGGPIARIGKQVGGPSKVLSGCFGGGGRKGAPEIDDQAHPDLGHAEPPVARDRIPCGAQHLVGERCERGGGPDERSEEHTSEIQSR